MPNWSMCRLIGAGLLLGAFCYLQPYRLGVVMGNSMAPTYRGGTLYLLETRSTRQVPRRGDIVVFQRDGVNYFKRVHAQPGDVVYLLRTPRECTADELLDDGQSARLARALRARTRWRSANRVVAWRIPEGVFYVLGDHRAVSEDSRAFGPIPLEQIRGRVLFSRPAEPPADSYARAGEGPGRT